MSARRLLAFVCVLGVSVTGISAASAAPKKPKAKPLPTACNLIVDEAGDVAPVASETIDIKSADVASDGKAVTAVLRVQKYTANEPASISGKRFIVAFQGGGLQPMYLRALDHPLNAAPGGDPTGNLPFDFGITEPGDTPGSTTYTSKGPATGSISESTGEITITAQAKELAAAGLGKLTTGVVMKGLNAITFRRVHTRLLEADTAASNATYTVGQPSCVKVG